MVGYPLHLKRYFNPEQPGLSQSLRRMSRFKQSGQQGVVVVEEVALLVVVTPAGAMVWVGPGLTPVA